MAESISLETRLLEKMQILENKIDALSLDCKTKLQLEQELEESIISNHKDTLENNKGKYLAFTYTGKLIASSSDSVELLKRLKAMDMLNNQAFVYAVPLIL